MLDPIQNQALRLCLGAFKTSPVASLCVEANEPPLSVRREKLSLQYASKIASTPENPVYNSIFHPNYEDLFNNKPNSIPPLGLRIKESLDNLELGPTHTAKFKYPDTPPWTYMPIYVNLSISESKKSNTDPSIYLSEYNRMKTILKDYEPIYTDGSRKDDKAAAAAVKGEHIYTERLPDRSSIFSAELHAVFLAMDHIETSRKRKFVIFSDSMSCLQAISGKDWKNPLVQKVLERLHNLQKELNKSVIFCWIPSHVGIKGNEAADTAAKAGLDLRVTNMPIPYADFKRYINEFVKSKWQSQWDEAIDNKLHSIQPRLGKWPGASRQIRREETVLTRVRIGHSRLTHSYLMKGEDPPECVPCQCPLTMKHILIDCIDFHNTRIQYFNVHSMKELFDNVQPTLILSFLKDIGLFYHF